MFVDRNRILVGLAIVLFAASPANSQVLAPEAFSGRLIVTDKARELFERWESGNMAGFKIESVDIAPRGRFLAGIVMFKNCEGNDNGNCQAQVDYTLYDPNGDVYGQLNDGDLWMRKPQPRRDHSQLAVQYLGIIIEPHDPPGTYRLKAEIRDQVSGDRATVWQEFLVLNQ